MREGGSHFLSQKPGNRKLEKYLRKKVNVQWIFDATLVKNDEIK